LETGREKKRRNAYFRATNNKEKRRKCPYSGAGQRSNMFKAEGESKEAPPVEQSRPTKRKKNCGWTV